MTNSRRLQKRSRKPRYLSFVICNLSFGRASAAFEGIYKGILDRCRIVVSFLCGELQADFDR